MFVFVHGSTGIYVGFQGLGKCLIGCTRGRLGINGPPRDFSHNQIQVISITTSG